MMHYRILLFGLLLLGGAAWAAAAPVVSKETVRSSQGIFHIWHRTPAEAADLGVPILADGTVQESFVYRVRDRKMRDVMRYARIRLTGNGTAETAVAFYKPALGKAVREEIARESGEVTLVAGAEDDFRKVVITPQDGHAAILLEHVQTFPIPPRQYTPREQQVLRILEQVRGTYRTARRVAYTMERRVEYIEDKTDEPNPPPVKWTVDFARPDRLTAHAAIGDKEELTINTRDGKLELVSPGRSTETRPINKLLQSKHLPEMQDDPAFRLMLGDDLVADGADYLGLQAVENVPLQQQAILILTFPEDHSVLRLFIDRKRNTLLRCETLITEDEYRENTYCTYTDLQLDLPEVKPTPPPKTAAAPVQ